MSMELKERQVGPRLSSNERVDAATERVVAECGIILGRKDIETRPDQLETTIHGRDVVLATSSFALVCSSTASEDVAQERVSSHCARRYCFHFKSHHPLPLNHGDDKDATLQRKQTLGTVLVKRPCY